MEGRRRRRFVIVALALAVHASPVAAAGPGTICFGAEPSWGLRFHDERRATLSIPDQRAVEYRGRATPLPPRNEQMWRGRPASGQGEDLVAFLSDATCSDGMSDNKHPMTARVSLPSGRFLAGCCRFERTGGMTGIEGRTWMLAGLPGTDLPRGNHAVTARFEGGRVSGFSGCNRFTGGYTLEGSRLVIGSLATTMTACPEPAMSVERAVTRVLAGAFRADAVDRSLTLASESGPTLTFVEAAEAMLDGSQWKVTGFNNGRQAVVSPKAGTTLSLAFKGGVVSGNAGCNTFRGSYAAEAGRMKIGALATTRKACSQAGVMQQEREFIAALESATTWAIDRTMLDMHRADGERVLTATRTAR